MNEAKLGLRRPRPFKKQLRTCSCTIPFSGLFNRKSCSNIASEFIKYILLQREQVPQTFNTSLVAATAVAASRSTTTSSSSSSCATTTEITAATTTKITSNVDEKEASSSTHGNITSKCKQKQQWETKTDTKKVGETTVQNITTTTIAAKAASTAHQTKSDICSMSRRSIPTYSFEATKSDVIHDENMRLGGATVRHSGSSFGRRSVAHSERKRLQSLNVAVQIFAHLDMAFTQSVLPIRKLVLIIGSSLVTPKDTFVLTFPTNHLEGDDLPLDSIKKTLFRELVTNDFIESFRSTATNCLRRVYILLLANRDNGIPWFIPSTRFSLPPRGNLYNVTLSNPPLNSSVNVSDSSLLDISGINPMETTAYLPESPYPPSAKKMRLHQSFEKLCDEDELIWYQAPVTFKGFR